MSKVSTRPKKPATPVAVQKHQSSTCYQVQERPSPIASSALAIAERVKEDHERAKDAEGISVHSLTLVELAIKSLQRFAVAEAAKNGLNNAACELAYEVAALLAGALAWDTQDSPSSTERHALLEQAYTLMDAAAMSFGLESGPCEALAIGVQAGATAKAPKGYTVQQLHDALELVAVRASTLESMLMDIGERCVGTVPAWELATAVNGATIVANSIGGVADEASGGGIVGDWETWTFGPNFVRSGKGVQS